MPEPEKVVVAPEEPDRSQDPVEVAPAVKASEEDQLAAKIKADFEALYGSRISQVEKQFENFRQGAYRIQDELKKENAQLKSQVETSRPRPTPAASPAQDPWAGIENGSQWKAEIERLAEEKATERLQRWQTEQQQQSLLATQQATLAASKERVVERYPDLHPETGTTDSLVAKTYVAVLTTHPDWLTNPYGPELAMYAMEEQLKAAASASGQAGKSRTAQAALLPPRPTKTGPESLTLTREQKAFCDHHQIKYEEFLKTAAALEQGVVEA